MTLTPRRPQKPSEIVVFAEEGCHPFYRAFAAGLGSTEIRDYRDGPEWVRRGHANLALIDCGLEIELGLELLREIKKTHPATMVVVVTEKGSEDTALEAFRSGARLYLRKPVEMANLRRLSNSMLDLKRATREKRSIHAQRGPFRLAGGAGSGKPANLMRAVRFIEYNLGKSIDLETCAGQANLSKFQFCRAFKRHFGIPPMRFVKCLRISRAQDLLSRDDMSITEIAKNVGFKDPNNLTKVFKKQTGVRPREFRSAAKGGLRS